MKYFYYILFTLLLISNIYSFEKVELRVSEGLKNDFTQITKSYYENPIEVNALFASLRESSKPYCQMMWKKKSFNRRIATAHVSSSSLKRYQRTCPRCNPSIIAGCWNFFKLNDRRPDKDFRLVKLIYKAKNFDCYSVGFLQPYLMHNELDCHSVTMLDFDWKILDAHWQFIQLLKEKALVNSVNFDSNLQRLKLAWVAFDEPYLKPEVSASMRILCKVNQRTLCRGFISKIQSKVDSVKKFRFNLTSLHEADYRNPGSNRIKVVFLSNAIEDIYTSEKDFQSLMKHLYYSMNTYQKAIIIHHAGGHLGFGLYEFNRLAVGHKIRTLCKDKYRNTVRARPGRYYDTYFEKATTTNAKDIVSCTTLLIQKERQLTIRPSTVKKP